MAQGWIRYHGKLAGLELEIWSAGTEKSEVKPAAIMVMQEVNIDLSGHTSKTLYEVPDAWNFDVVVMVCDSANETCFTYPVQTARLHVSFPDPSGQNLEWWCEVRNAFKVMAEVSRLNSLNGIDQINPSTSHNPLQIGYTRSVRRRFLFYILFLFATSSLAQPFVVGIHFDQGDWSDPGFNQDLWEGVNAATKDLSENTIDVLLFRQRMDANGQLTSLPGDLDLIIVAGVNQLPFVQAVASSLPNTHILLLDAVLEAPNVNSILFKEYEVSYILGYLAGSLTQTGVLGFIGEMQDQKTLANASTYTQGVSAACPDCTVATDYLGEINNPDKANALAATQQLKGVDIFFAPAGGSSIGVINYVNTTMCIIPTTLRPSALTAQLSSVSTSLAYTAKCQNAVPLFFIGNDNDQPHVGDGDKDPTTLNHALSAIHKRLDRLAYQALLDNVNGRSDFGTKILGLADGSIDYALNDYNRDLIPEELMDQLEVIKAQIISGEIILTLPAVTPVTQ